MTPTVTATLDRVDAAWRPFCEAARATPSALLVERREGAWTRSEMLGHIAAWHVETTRRLRTLLDSGEMTGPPASEDAFNARLALVWAGRPAPDVLDALDTSFGDMRAAMAQLTEEQLHAGDGWAAAIIAGNTFGHY